MARWPWVLVRRRGVPTIVTFSMEDPREARKARHNERVKLIANALNGLAITLASTGAIGPLVSIFLRHPDAPLSQMEISSETLAFIGIWCGLGLTLHLAANLVMRWLR